MISIEIPFLEVNAHWIFVFHFRPNYVSTDWSFTSNNVVLHHVQPNYPVSFAYHEKPFAYQG